MNGDKMAIDETRQALREAIDEGEVRFQALLDTVPGAIVIIDEVGTIYFFSRGAEEQFGYKAHEVVGSNVTMLMPQSERSEHDDHLARYTSTGTPHIIGTSREVQGQRRDGSTFPIELAVGEYQDGRRYFVGHIQDISDRREAEKRVQGLQRQLRQASQTSALGQMGSVLAHELNQPLTALTNYIETWRRAAGREGTDLPPALADLSQAALDEAHRASETLTNLRELFAGKQPELAPESIEDVIDEALSLRRASHDDPDVVIDSEVESDLPDAMMVRTQILEVLVNLLQNSYEALADTKSGRVHIGCRQADDRTVEVSVTDTGRGLDPEISDKLFEPFATTKPSGMGLGLAICRSIIEAHGGRLWSTARANGAAFHFTLPTVQDR